MWDPVPFGSTVPLIESVKSKSAWTHLQPVLLFNESLQELAAQHAEREEVVRRVTLPICASSTERQFLAQVTEPQVFVNASYAFKRDSIRSSRASSRMRSQFAPGSALP
jgi:hypothetical protein